MTDINSSVRWLIILLLIGTTAWIAVPNSEDQLHIVISPKRGAFNVTVTTTGMLQAKNAVDIYGPTSAQQTRIFQIKILELVPEGTFVEEGDFVAELDRSELLSKIEETRINLDQSESDYLQARLDTALTLFKARDQIERLQAQAELKKTLVAESIYEPRSVQRQAELDFADAKKDYQIEQKSYATQAQQAEGKIRRAYNVMQRNKDYYDELISMSDAFTVTAPAAGMVIYKRDWEGRSLTTGGIVNAWNPVIATLPDFSVMESVTYVNEVDIEKIKLGQQVEVGLDAQAGKVVPGVVTKIANIGEQTDNMEGTVFKVTIEITETDNTLRPALTTSNTILVTNIDNVLSVPLECIHTSDSLNFVYVLESGTTVKKEVILGMLNENEIIVEAGLTEKNQVYMSLPSEKVDSPIVRITATN